MPSKVQRGSATVRIYPQTTRLNGKTYKSWSVHWHFNGAAFRKKFSKATLAKSFAASKATALANGQTAALRLTDADAAIYAAAVQLAEGTGRTVLSIVEEWVAASKLAPVLTAAEFHARHHKRGAGKTFAEVVVEFNAAKERDGTRWRHRRDLRTRLALLAKHITGALPLLTTGHFTAVLDALQRKHDWTNRTRNHFRATLLNLGNFAIRAGHVPRDWAEHKHVERLQEVDGPVTVYTPEQLELYLAATEPADIPAVVCLFFAGIRHTEVQGDRKDKLRPLDLSDINWNTGEVFIGEGKVRTAGQRFAHLPRNALAWLRRYAKRSGPVTRRRDLSHMLTDIAAKAGLPWWPDVHRHSYISHRLAKVRDMARVSEETGTSTATLRKKYRRPLPKGQAARYFKLLPPAAPANVTAFNSLTKRSPKSAVSAAAKPAESVATC